MNIEITPKELNTLYDCVLCAIDETNDFIVKFSGNDILSSSVEYNTKLLEEYKSLLEKLKEQGAE